MRHLTKFINPTLAQKRQDYDRMVFADSADLYRYGFWLCHNQAKAEDLVKKTFLRAWKIITKSRSRSIPKEWLFATLRNLYVHQYTRPRSTTINIDSINSKFKGKQSSISKEIFDLHRALNSLPEEDRELLFLQVFGGFGYTEIGSICNISKEAAMTRLFRAKRKLRDMRIVNNSTLIH